MWHGRDIAELPTELLNTPIRVLPMTVLRKIANMLHVDSGPTGNWEMVAEKLVFSNSSRLEELSRQARVQQQYPGLLLLSEWGRIEGSTALVLLHVLRDCDREDIINYLVNALFEMDLARLYVMIYDEEGRGQRSLQVRTAKSAPLHASLENELVPGIYMYDIVSPQHVTWETPARELQGAQLTLKKRKEPSAETYSLIYGTLGEPPPQFPTLQTWNSAAGPLTLNIPPSDVRLTYSQFGATELNIEAVGPNIRLLPQRPGTPHNNLSSAHQPTVSKNGQSSRTSPPVQGASNTFIPGLQLPPPNPCLPAPLQGLAPPPPLPPPCLPRRQPEIPSVAAAQLVFSDVSFRKDDDMELDDRSVEQNLTGANNGQAGGPLFSFHTDTTWPKVPAASVPLHVDQASFQRQFGLSGFQSHTQPKEQENGAGRNFNVPNILASVGFGNVRVAGQNLGNSSAMDPTENDEYSDAADLQVEMREHAMGTSTKTGDYLPHSMMIRFCNPSPGSATQGSESPQVRSASTATSTSTSAYVFYCINNDSQPENPLMDPCDMSDHSSSDENDHNGTSPARCSPADYVPHSFIERESQLHAQRSASVPVFPALLSMSSFESDSSLQSSSAVTSSSGSKERSKDFMYVNHGMQPVDPSPQQAMDASLQVENGSGWHPAGNTSTPFAHPRPAPCTYSTAFAGHGMGGTNSAPCLPHLYLALDHRRMAQDDRMVQTGAQQSVSTDTGYMDMSGTSRQDSLPWSMSSPLALSSLPTEGFLSFGGLSTSSGDLDSELGAADGEGEAAIGGLSLDSGTRKMSAPTACSSSASQSHLQPRNRRPIPENMLHSYLDEQNPSKYTYIDPQSVTTPRSHITSGEDAGQSSSRSRSSPSRPKTEDRRGSGSNSSSSRSPEAGGPPSLRVGQRENSPREQSLDPDQLALVPGWCPTVTERTIERVMAKHVNEDGNFIVWRCAMRSSYVISVTHLRQVRHYAVYETEERDGRISLYLFPRGFRSSSLTSLVTYYQRNSLSEPTKTFRTPEGERMEVQRGSASRFSHVKLRKALTVRYGHNSSKPKD